VAAIVVATALSVACGSGSEQPTTGSPAVESRAVESSADGSPADGSPAAGTPAPSRAAAPGIELPVEEWPQWGGPRRDFTSKATGLARRWPEGGPPVLWRQPLGEGYSAIAVRDGRLYTMYREGATEVVVSMDAGDGRTLWEHEYEAPIEGYNMDRGPGPHSTPLVGEDLVFTVGATARLHALDRETGAVRWSHDLIAEFGATRRGRGYASSPLAHGDTIILMVGGKGSALMAFDRADGSVVWSRHDFASSPSSPILIDVDGSEQVVALMYGEIVGVDPRTGDLLWTHPHKTELGQNISTPVWGEGNLLYVSSGYGVGSRVVRLARDGEATVPEELWHNQRMRLHFGNAIRVGDRIYGSSGDFGPGFFAAIEARTGEIPWRQRGFGKASFLLADGLFVILDENGVLAIASPTPEGLTVHAQAEVMDRNSWTVPTLVGTTLYVRDRKSLAAFDLG
jgi:outer membrane protein assembly factor BamB